MKNDPKIYCKDFVISGISIRSNISLRSLQLEPNQLQKETKLIHNQVPLPKLILKPFNFNIDQSFSTFPKSPNILCFARIGCTGEKNLTL